jgi:hypothetical protein
MQFRESLHFCTAHPSSGPIEENDEQGEDAGLVLHGCMRSQLLKEVEKCAMEDGFPHAHPNRSLELESVGQRFNSMVHSGKLRAAVRAVTYHDPGGLYAPNNVCTKMGLRVLDIICKQHPGARIPKELAFDD